VDCYNRIRKTTMKAALIDGKSKLWVDTVPDPQPGPYDALCEILCGATCTGTDSHLIDGSFQIGRAHV